MSQITELKNNKLSVGISSLGAELIFINSDKGTEFLWEGDKKVWPSHAPILFPICGGLKDDKYIFNNKEYYLRKHGFAAISEFTAHSLSDTKVEFKLEWDKKSFEMFPFKYRLKITYELKENSLIVTNEAENLSDYPMYFSIGAHEGYACPEGIEEYSIIFDEKQTLESYNVEGNLLGNKTTKIIENQDVLDLKYEYFAIDALIFKNTDFHKVTLKHKKSNKKIVLDFSGFQNLLIWTKPDAKYICLEPWNGLPDTVDSNYDITSKEGIIKLEKDNSFKVIHKIEFYE